MSLRTAEGRPLAAALCNVEGVERRKALLQLLLVSIGITFHDPSPLILPGVISGALFAFVTSFDEVVVVLFVGSIEEQTIPRQMWAGIREEISPIILAVATLLICVSTLVMIAIEVLRRYNEKQRGVAST